MEDIEVDVEMAIEDEASVLVLEVLVVDVDGALLDRNEVLDESKDVESDESVVDVSVGGETLELKLPADILVIAVSDEPAPMADNGVGDVVHTLVEIEVDDVLIAEELKFERSRVELRDWELPEAIIPPVVVERDEEDSDTCIFEDDTVVDSSEAVLGVPLPLVPVIRQLQAELTLEGLPPHPSIHTGVVTDEVRV